MLEDSTLQNTKTDFKAKYVQSKESTKKLNIRPRKFEKQNQCFTDALRNRYF